MALSTALSVGELLRFGRGLHSAECLQVNCSIFVLKVIFANFVPAGNY